MPAATDPPFTSIAIVGLGLIGGSIALAARRAWPACRIGAVDRAEVLAQAQAIGAIDAAAPDVARMADADLIVLAAPVGQNVTLLEELGRHLTGRAVVTDVGGTKRPIVAAARRLPSHLTFVGGHPLGGAARGGFEFARPDLFTQRPWILTPAADDAGRPVTVRDSLDRLSAFAAALGAIPRTMTPEDHDRVMAFVSHLPQLTASALMDVVGRSTEDALGLAGQGLVDTTRLASSPASVWKDICAGNADAIGPALDLLIARLQEIRDGLGREERVEALFGDAARWRAVLMKDRE